MSGREDLAAVVEAVGNGRWHRQAVMMSAPEGAAAEQYRVLRERLLPAISGGVRRIAVTSATAGEGRTTTAVNLALALSLGRHYRVALVDAHVRSPGVHSLLGLTPQAGLVDVVGGAVALDAALWRFGAELYVLPAGRLAEPRPSLSPGPATTPRPAAGAHEVFASPRLAEVFAALQDRCDVMIVDAPPILPAADMLTLAPSVDGLVVVVQAGRTPKDLLAVALAALPPVRILGTVLHRVQPSMSSPYALYARHDREARPSPSPVRTAGESG